MPRFAITMVIETFDMDKHTVEELVASAVEDQLEDDESILSIKVRSAEVDADEEDDEDDDLDEVDVDAVRFGDEEEDLDS